MKPFVQLKNWFVESYNGKSPLWVAFWVCGIGVFAVAQLFFELLESQVYLTHIVVVTIFAIQFVYAVFWRRLINRCKKNTSSTLWSVLAGFLSLANVIVALLMLGLIIFTGHIYNFERSPEGKQPYYSKEVEDNFQRAVKEVNEEYEQKEKNEQLAREFCLNLMREEAKKKGYDLDAYFQANLDWVDKCLARKLAEFESKKPAQ